MHVIDWLLRYYNCVYGFPHPYTCPTPLVFDEAQGTCVRKDQASSFAKNCTESTEKETIAGSQFAKFRDTKFVFLFLVLIIKVLNKNCNKNNSRYEEKYFVRSEV